MSREQYKNLYRETFDTVAAGYDHAALRFFATGAAHLVGSLELRGDEEVLDVATGTGHVALALARCLPRGRVTGIDFSGGMLAQAEAKARQYNVENVRFMEMDMQSIDLPDSHFDVAVSSFGIFFVEDMAAQLHHIATKVKPGGTVAITSFTQNSFSPLVGRFLVRLEEGYNIVPPIMSWKRVANEGSFAALFEAADLDWRRVECKDLGYYLPDGEAWWDVLWNGGFRGLLSQLRPEDLERFKEEHLAEIEQFATANGIWLEIGMLVGLATRRSTLQGF